MKIVDSDVCCDSASKFPAFSLFSIFACLSTLVVSSYSYAQPRVLGIDVSAWQGNISQTTWNNIHSVEDREFVFIRSTRGGTTGEDHRQGGYPASDNDFYNLSQRYDDPYFAQNITRATNAGLLAGPYHYGRPDIIASTPNSGGIPNNGTDEANHFLEMAGAWMRPGYLLPVFDLEAGINEHTPDSLAQFSIDFSNRIYDIKGIRTTMYINGSYSQDLQSASFALRSQLVTSFPTLWDARYEFQSNPDDPGVQTSHPKNTYGGFYGPWDDSPNPEHPWNFWQYASTGRLQSYNNGNSNLDFNVAQGGIEFLKDHLVPALWTTDSDGLWATLTNWNSGQTPSAPAQAPGQLTPIGTLTLPTERLPAGDDTVILDRPNANIVVTLDSGSHSIRKLEAREQLNITAGSLTINYAPSADSTPYSARFSAPVTLDGGSLSLHTLQVDAAQTFTLNSGTLTLDTIELTPHSTTPAQLSITGDILVNAMNGTSATIVSGAGGGNSGLVDLGGANPVWSIADGAAAVDLSVEVPVVNGGLTKSGTGTMALTGAASYSGDTWVQKGILSLGSSVLSDAADVYLSPGTILDLNHSDVDTVDSLFLDGVSQPAGIWGGVGSSAPFTSPQITGNGLLAVSTFVNPFTADFDGDGDVDGDDITDPVDGWEARFGADLDGMNFLDWQREFGSGGSPLAAIATTVPEPTSVFLLVIGSTLAAAGTKRRCID